jgi:hypothetical protein
MRDSADAIRTLADIAEVELAQQSYTASRKSVPQTGTFAEAMAWEGARLASRPEAYTDDLEFP